MIVKKLVGNDVAIKDSSSKNIERYMKKALERGDSIYFYAIDHVKIIDDINGLKWIRDVKHEEYDELEINWKNGWKDVYQSKVLSDKVIKLDLTDEDAKKVFDEKFKIGTTWARGNISCKIGEGDPLFEKEPGYEFHNFVVAYNDEAIMDVTLHGGFVIGLAKDIVDEVDKECEEERKRKWRKIIFPFSRQ